MSMARKIARSQQKTIAKAAISAVRQNPAEIVHASYCQTVNSLSLWARLDWAVRALIGRLR